MDTFGFTKKKFLSLSRENRNRHIITWLTGFYQRLVTNRFTPESLDGFCSQYNRILGWIEAPSYVKPFSDQPRLWVESISDRIHLHREETRAVARDWDLLEKVQMSDLSVRPDRIELNCHVALDGLRSLYNVGSIFRTCEAAGFKSVILGNTLGKNHPGVRKTAMGADQWIEEETTQDLAHTLLEKKGKGFTVIGIETFAHARPYSEISWKDNTIVVFGNEEYGIASHVLKTCDSFAHIPMFGRKNSINVANAVSVICFHIACTLRRQFQ